MEEGAPQGNGCPHSLKMKKAATESGSFLIPGKAMASTLFDFSSIKLPALPAQGIKRRIPVTDEIGTSVAMPHCVLV